MFMLILYAILDNEGMNTCKHNGYENDHFEIFYVTSNYSSKKIGLEKTRNVLTCKMLERIPTFVINFLFNYPRTFDQLVPTQNNFKVVIGVVIAPAIAQPHIENEQSNK